MADEFQPTIKDSRVFAARLAEAVYDENEIARALGRAAQNLGWAAAGEGENGGGGSSDRRGAFGKAIRKGAKVVVKPNFVLHENRKKDEGILPLVTHQSLIRAVVAEVLKADPAQVVVGDAPVQSCDFAELLRATGLDVWAVDLQERDARFLGVRDYRRTICRFVDGVRRAEENLQPAENYVLYNLGAESLLEAVTDGKNSFRVTCYDPRLMAKTHSPGNHQYLVAREIVEADVIINLPKLKTHKKAGVTNALKNLVGINGNKEFLPHHRVGGARQGGDCYPASDFVKRAWETVADRQNMTRSPNRAKILATVNAQLERLMRLKGDEIGVEGAWSGNETVPRMTLDLNRILLYGRTDATLAENLQRRVLHVVDAVVAGQGDGPLAPEPLALGLILASESAAAADWVGARLLGYDAGRIPLVRMAFDDFRWPIADFSPDKIEFFVDGEEISAAEDFKRFSGKRKVNLPAGWRDAQFASDFS